MTYINGLHPSHKTRYSDASTFDEICTLCGAKDVTGGGWGKLAYKCPQNPRHKAKELKSELK